MNSQLVQPETELLSLTFLGDPVPKGRPRVVRGSTYTPADVVAAEEALGWRMKRTLPRNYQLDKNLEYAVWFHFYMRTRRRMDLDNLIKLVCDAGNKIVWYDDSQIVEIHALITRADPQPRTEMTVRIHAA